MAATVFNGALYAVWNGGNVIYGAYTTNGTNWTTMGIPIGQPEGVDASSKPSLAAFGSQLILSYTTTEGNIFTAYSNGGASAFVVNPTYTTVTANHGSSLAVFNNQLYLSFTTGSNNNPVLCSTTLATGAFTSGSVCNVDYGIEIGNDPAIVPYNGVLVLQGKSNFSEDNLWGTTYSIQGGFTPQYEYGQSLTQSPALATFNGQIFECAKSKNGSNIWCYYN